MSRAQCGHCAHVFSDTCNQGHVYVISEEALEPITSPEFGQRGPLRWARDSGAIAVQCPACKQITLADVPVAKSLTDALEAMTADQRADWFGSLKWCLKCGYEPSGHRCHCENDE